MRTRLFFLVLLCGALAAPLAAGELALSLDWGGASLSRPFPVTGGVPFARGALKDAGRVRLSQGTQELPLQTEALAWWPDGSVKWLLLDFQAPTRATSLSLRYGEGVAPAPLPAGITAAEGPAGVTVNTGPLRFTVRPDGSGFLDELDFHGQPISRSAGRRANFLDFFHADAPADSPPMDRLLRHATPDPSRVVVERVALEKRGPLHAVVRIDGHYAYRTVGSTITGTEVKGDCPFRLRLHAYAGWSLLKVEHFFVYEGDGDHDFAGALGLRLGLPPGQGSISYLGDETLPAEGPISGLYQSGADEFALWNSDGRRHRVIGHGRRFEGVLDVRRGDVAVAVGVREFWQNHAKALRADLKAGEVTAYLWPPEAPPLDFRRHAREWSVGETGTPDDPKGTRPAPIAGRANYRLASKGVGKTHYVLFYVHPASERPLEVRAVYRLFSHRPLLWAPAGYYAETLALGRYRERVPGEHDDIEEILDRPTRFLRFSREAFRWYGFWTYGNVCQEYNEYIQNGRWNQEFGRWGWGNGDSMGRLSYALALQAVRRCTREDLEFAESFLYNVHDCCSTHTPAYPEHGGESFLYLKGAAHRHGAWPWAGPYVGIRGAHPVGAKLYYFLTGEGHAADILEEVTQLVLRNPNGGEGDGPLGPNAQIYLYQWEHTGKPEWRDRLKAELAGSDGLKNASSGWDVMMTAAFGEKDALDEYMDLSGDRSLQALSVGYADRCLPEKFKNHWTWGGYYRVYASAYNASGNPKYRRAIEEMLDVLKEHAQGSLPFKLPEAEWPGPPGGPAPAFDANIVRDVPFALYALHTDAGGKP